MEGEGGGGEPQYMENIPGQSVVMEVLDQEGNQQPSVVVLEGVGGNDFSFLTEGGEGFTEGQILQLTESIGPDGTAQIMLVEAPQDNRAGVGQQIIQIEGGGDASHILEAMSVADGTSQGQTVLVTSSDLQQHDISESIVTQAGDHAQPVSVSVIESSLSQHQQQQCLKEAALQQGGMTDVICDCPKCKEDLGKATDDMMHSLSDERGIRMEEGDAGMGEGEDIKPVVVRRKEQEEGDLLADGAPPIVGPVYVCGESGCQFRSPSKFIMQQHIIKVHKAIPREGGPMAKKKAQQAQLAKKRKATDAPPGSKERPLVWRQPGGVEGLAQLTADARVDIDRLPAELIDPEYIISTMDAELEMERITQSRKARWKARGLSVMYRSPDIRRVGGARVIRTGPGTVRKPGPLCSKRRPGRPPGSKKVVVVEPIERPLESNPVKTIVVGPASFLPEGIKRARGKPKRFDDYDVSD